MNFHSDTNIIYTQIYEQQVLLCIFIYTHNMYTEIAKSNSAEDTATHRNTLQHTATHCNLHTHTYTQRSQWATKLKTPQHSATHCNTLQHTATHILIHIHRDRNELLSKITRGGTEVYDAVGLLQSACRALAMREQVLQGVVGCCRVLQCFAVCCSELHRSELQCVVMHRRML